MTSREELIRAVQAVTWNASNYPPKIQPYILGQDIVPLTMKIVDAVEAVFEQAHTPTSDERVPGFSEREKRAARAWEFFTRGDREMSHDFRGGYHQGMIDGFRRAVQSEPTDAAENNEREEKP